MTAEAAARAAALHPPYALGGPAAGVTLRERAEDFQVEEDLGFAPSGAGAHLLLKVRKVDANTAWVARELARHTGCSVRDVGYAGLKDRRALAVQWFSVPRPRGALDPLALAGEGYSVLEAHPHQRKLPRGALAGNRFRIRLRGAAGAALAERLASRLEAVGRLGVPNYFGVQRFGRQGANLAHPTELKELKPAERGFVLSAARSVVFNAVLAARVSAGSWNELQPGDLACLDGRGSLFAVDAVDATLRARCARLEIHPTGPLWGEGGPPGAGAPAALETLTATRFAAQCRLCVQAGMRQERRALRLAVQELQSETEADALVLSFRLNRGSFATAVLRELVEADAAGGDAQE